MPEWARNLDWSYIEDESSEYCLEAQNTGIEIETRYWPKSNLKFRIVGADWFGERENDVKLIPRRIEDLKNTVNDNYLVWKTQTITGKKLREYISRRLLLRSD